MNKEKEIMKEAFSCSKANFAQRPILRHVNSAGGTFGCTTIAIASTSEELKNMDTKFYLNPVYI